MNEQGSFAFPDITDEEIHRATRVLGLPEDAFHGKNGKDPRQDALKCQESIDIVSCPGSGKTTLLVAKLAILADKWPHHTRGICVLSHTNVARNEIETRLGNTAVGRRLLSYPHFIGTIHGFVNEFLSKPWLRSKCYPMNMIDTDICQRRRWMALSPEIRGGLERNHYDPSILSIKAPDFSVGELRWGRGLLGTNSPTNREIVSVCKQSTKDGYFCYDEMFVWANDLIQHVPGAIHVIRDRFPLLFIDEAQDNSEDQSAILYHIFIKGEGPVIRQRLGDPNQAIFDFVEAKEADTDPFPSDAMKMDIPNSHRFGQNIAKLADSLGLIPYRCCLIGQGPRTPLASGTAHAQHTLFLFRDDEAEKVLTSYGELLLETFSEQELRKGTFTALGQVHKDKRNDHKPRHVRHYWPNYDSEISDRDPRPQTLIQYIWAGAGKADIIGESFPLVEKIAQGIIRLAGMPKSAGINFNRRHCHRYVRELLETKTDVLSCYAIMVSRLGARRKLPTKQTWENRWCGVVRKIAETISGTALSGFDVEEFLKWKDPPEEAKSESPLRKSCANVYCFTKDGRQVQIRVGSIHSAKGQTHTATLVLETFWHQHNLKSLLPWLDGTNPGAPKNGGRQKTRLKIHYVAMTRPSHLLCLAMKRSIFENEHGDLDEGKLAQLQNLGWQIKCVG